MKKALLLLLFSSCSVLAAPPNIPVPLNVQASPVSPSKIRLTWLINGNVNGYYVEKCANVGGVCQRVASLSAQAYVDQGLYADTTYYYRVRAYKGNNQSNPSPIVSTITSPLQAPVVSAGMNQAIDVLFAQLRATVTVDGLRPTDVLVYLWEVAAGPTGAVIENPAALSTMVTFLTPGVYNISFKATINP